MKLTKSELKTMIREALREELRLTESASSDKLIYLYVSKSRLPNVGATLQRNVASLEDVERADVQVISTVNQFMTAFSGLNEFGDNENIAIYVDKDKTSVSEIAELFKKAPEKRPILAANLKYVEA